MFWTINLLGTFYVEREDSVITRFRTKKTGALLALLAHYDNRTFRREELIEMLWPESPPESGRNCLRIALSALRHDLEDPGRHERFVIADRSSVRLNSSCYQTDKAEFENGLKLAKTAQQEEARIAMLAKSVAAYHGDLLPGYDEDWIMGERQRLANAFQLALRNLIKLLAQARNYEEALEYARRAVDADPLREESHRILMRLYLMMGQPSAALRQFQHLERLLSDELGMLPSDSSRELARECTGGATGAARPPMADSGRQPTTESALPPEPMRPPIAGPGVRRSPVSPAHPRSPATLHAGGTAGLRGGSGLPGFTTRFFGRDACIRDIIEMLDSPEIRLVTLTGFGGTGKTRVAAEVADRLHAASRRAIWFVPLAALSEPQLIPDAIADVLGLTRTTDTAPIDQIVRVLEARPTLLVLDNFEQLVEQGAFVVQDLLQRVPALKILVTSRRQLKLTSEFGYVVPPLTTPAVESSLTELLQFPVIQIFVDRVRRARLNFQVTPANAAAITTLCQRLDGIPLAVELAASWAQTLSPAQMLERLASNLPLLVSHNRDVPDRHASLWKAIDWSYQALPPETRRFFVRLAIFRGSFTLAATEAICQEARAFEYLTQLQELSLLSVEETEEDLRFFLPETLREYAEYQLEDGELAALERRHVEYYLRMAEEAEPNLRGADAAQWLHRLDSEIMNIRAAVQRFVTHPALGLRLTGALWRYWYLRGRYQEGYNWLESALQTEYDGPIAVRIKALGGAGNIAYSRWDYAAARELFEEVLVLARESNDQRMVAAALGSLGNIANDQGLYGVARTSQQECLAIYQALGDARGTALTVANLANIAGDEGDLETARDLYQESIAMLRSQGATSNLVVALNNFARNRVRADDFASARALLAEFLKLNRQLDNRASLVECVETAASLAVRQAEFQRAAQLLGMADSLRASAQMAHQPKTEADHTRDRNQARAGLGAADFDALWAAGHSMAPSRMTGFLMEILKT